MAYRENWLRHLFAFLTGEGWSNSLARDFWYAEEDLWEPDKPITWRWLKLSWVYSVSAIAQITLPLFISYAILNLFFLTIPLRWWLIGVGGLSVIAWVFAILFATAECVDQRRRLRSARKAGDGGR